MLPITVITIIIMLATMFVFFFEAFAPKNICTMLLKILPPSNGYIGSKLNKTINVFAYIIICLS